MALKNRGAGAAMTGTKPSAVGESIRSDIDLGGILGPIATGIGQGIRDRIAGRGRGRGQAPPPPPQFFPPGGGGGGGPCPAGTIRFPPVFGPCLDLQPGGATQGAGMVATPGEAVVGAFGMPAMLPEAEQRVVRNCGPGMVLGKDDLCYPRAVLGRRNRFRKWRAPTRPPITSSDMKAIRTATRARDRVKDLAKDVGFTCRKR